MNRTIAQSLLDSELLSLGQMGYSHLRSLVNGEPIVKEIVGPDGQRYQIEASIFWDNKKNGPIRLIISIDDGGLRAFFPLTNGDLIYPEEPAT